MAKPDTGSVCALVEQGQLQLDRFDKHNLLELDSSDYPVKQPMACYNPQLAALRTLKRQELLKATEKSLQAIKECAQTCKLAGTDAIGLHVGKVFDQYKVARHLELAIVDNAFTHGAAHCVHTTSRWRCFERALCSLTTIDFKVRPVHHWLADRVRAHVLLHACIP